MEKEIVWTETAEKNFWKIVSYLKSNWPPSVLTNFEQLLKLKLALLQKQRKIGFKSSRHSKFRKTIVTYYYSIIYSIEKEHIVIHRIKHSAMRK
ncbi:MAG: hypothetical protein JWQ09_973 [Segetibacter sp.]|nr:hypothetical protein [Segetibacter sp.]